MDPALDKASAAPQEPAPAQGAPTYPTSSPGLPAKEEFRWRVFLEPRGFLRAIEFVLAVCMFATTAGYGTSYSFVTKGCGSGFTYVVSVHYPFKLESTPYPAICNDTTDHYAGSDPSGSAQFFVAVGVLAMLYTIGTAVWYVIFEAKHPEKEIHFIVDLVVTAIFVLLFFISSCAWAAGLNDVKYWSNFDNLAKNELVYKPVCDLPTSGCLALQRANFASLNVSVVFGFLNTVVWGGNLWFIYKETSWFRARMEKKAGADAPPNPNQV